MVSIAPRNAIAAENYSILADSFREECRLIGHELGGEGFSPAKIIGDMVTVKLKQFEEPYMAFREFTAIVQRVCLEVTNMAEQKSYPAATMHSVWEAVDCCAKKSQQIFSLLAAKGATPGF